MSYLNISQAAWSLVLSKDPKIKPKPRPPVSASSAHNTASDSNYAARNSENSKLLDFNTQQTNQKLNAAGQIQRVSGRDGSHIAAGISSSTAAAQALVQHQQAEASVYGNEGLDPSAQLPMELQLQGPASKLQPPSVWSPSVGESPGKWLAAAHGPAWKAEAAAAARAAAAAHRQLAGALEQRRAALLKDIGRARALDLKVLLQLVTQYADDLQVLLESFQASALHAQQDYTAHLASAAAAAVGGSIEAALDAAHKSHQEQLSCLQQRQVAQLEAARSSAAQQLAVAVQLQQQQAQQQLGAELRQVNESWGARCRAAEAAAEKQEALRAHADSECNKLRAELASAKKEAANWRARWERDYGSSSGGGNNSSSGGPEGAVARTGSGLPVAFEFGAVASSRRASRPSVS